MNSCKPPFLSLQLTHGFPQAPSPTFIAPTPFPIENRGGLQIQDMGAVKRQLDSARLAEAVSDFHLLVYLGTLGILGKVSYFEVVQTHACSDPFALLSERDGKGRQARRLALGCRCQCGGEHRFVADAADDPCPRVFGAGGRRCWRIEAVWKWRGRFVWWVGSKVAVPTLHL